MHADPWAHYLTTIVTVELPTGRLTVTPTEDEGAGGLPVGLSDPVHVVTAWNPGSEPLDRADNDRRNDALRRELDRRDTSWYPARGCSPDGTWCEEGFAINGWTRADACALARAHGQAAVFELLGGRLVVVDATDLDHAEVRPATVSVAP